MRGNLAFSDTPEDDDFRRPSPHPSRPYIVDSGNRPHSGSASRPQQKEDEIMVDFGLWVVFNKRILALIRRKYPNNNR